MRIRRVGKIACRSEIIGTERIGDLAHAVGSRGRTAWALRQGRAACGEATSAQCPPYASATPMLSQISRRLATVIPSLIGVIIVTFLLTRVLPGDTAAYFAGPAASAQAIEEGRKQLGLDKSFPEQFHPYVTDLVPRPPPTSPHTSQSFPP